MTERRYTGEEMPGFSGTQPRTRAQLRRQQIDNVIERLQSAIERSK
jgi:hypothetical protein